MICRRLKFVWRSFGAVELRGDARSWSCLGMRSPGLSISRRFQKGRPDQLVTIFGRKSRKFMRKQNDKNTTTMPSPTAILSPLHRADGSVTYSHDGYSVIAAVNGPLEVQRRDELPEEAAIEVNIRPAFGVASQYLDA